MEYAIKAAYSNDDRESLELLMGAFQYSGFVYSEA
jgi:hypothetical protein